MSEECTHDWEWARRGSRCTACGAKRFHGPRATIIAPEGNCFIDFDADGLHLRIAACLSKDEFIGQALRKYDETGDQVWKPHVQNTSALFNVTPEQAIDWMNKKAAEYTFSKNFIYMILNGGEVPSLRNAAANAGLKMDEQQVKKLYDRWLERAVGFRTWRERLVEEAETTRCVYLPDGRMRRYYGLVRRRKTVRTVDPHAERYWRAGEEVIKEVYNHPLIGGEVSVMNPRVLAVHQTLPVQWKLVLFEHDGYMVEGPMDDLQEEFAREKALWNPWHEFDKQHRLYIPVDGKWGTCWADLGKVPK